MTRATDIPSLREAAAPVGLANLGNTCYLNAMIQALFHTPQVRGRVLAARFDAEAEAAREFLAAAPVSGASDLVQLHARRYLRAVDFMCELQHVFGLLSASDRAAVEATQLLEAFAAYKGGEGAAYPALWQNFAASEAQDSTDTELAGALTDSVQRRFTDLAAMRVAAGESLTDDVRASIIQDCAARLDELLAQRSAKAMSSGLAMGTFDILAFFAQEDADEWRDAVLAMSDDTAMGFCPSEDGKAFTGVKADVARATPRFFAVKQEVLAGINTLRGVFSSRTQQVEIAAAAEGAAAVVETPLGPQRPLDVIRLSVVRDESCVRPDGTPVTDPMLDMQCRQSLEAAARSGVRVLATPCALDYVSEAAASQAADAAGGADIPWPLPAGYGLFAPGQVGVYPCLIDRSAPGAAGLPPSQRLRFENGAPVLYLSLTRGTASALFTSVHVPTELYLDELTAAEGATATEAWAAVRAAQAELARAEAAATTSAFSELGMAGVHANDVEEGWRRRVARLDSALKSAAGAERTDTRLARTPAAREQLKMLVSMGEVAFDSSAQYAQAVKELASDASDPGEAVRLLEAELAELVSQKNEASAKFADSSAPSGPEGADGGFDDALGRHPEVRRLRAAVADAYSRASSVRYRLMSAMLHVGPSAEGGHYTCFSRGDGPDLWWQLDDDKVRRVTRAEMLEALQSGSGMRRASTLFYEREPCDEGAGDADALDEPAEAAALAPTAALAAPVLSRLTSESLSDVSLLASEWRRDEVAEAACGLASRGTRWWEGLEPAFAAARVQPAATLALAAMPAHVAAFVRADNDHVRNVEGVDDATLAGTAFGGVLCELIRLQWTGSHASMPSTVVTTTGLTRAQAERWARDELAALRRMPAFQSALHAAEEVVSAFAEEPRAARPLTPDEVEAGWGTIDEPFAHGLCDCSGEAAGLPPDSQFARWAAAPGAAAGGAPTSPRVQQPPWSVVSGVGALVGRLQHQLDSFPPFGPVAVPTEARFRCTVVESEAAEGDPRPPAEVVRIPPDAMADWSVMDQPDNLTGTVQQIDAANGTKAPADKSTGSASSLPDAIRGAEARRAVAAACELRAVTTTRSVVAAAAAEPSRRVAEMLLARRAVPANAAAGASLPASPPAVPPGPSGPAGDLDGGAAAAAEPASGGLSLVVASPVAGRPSSEHLGADGSCRPDNDASEWFHPGDAQALGDPVLPAPLEDNGRLRPTILAGAAPGCLVRATLHSRVDRPLAMEREFIIAMACDAFVMSSARSAGLQHEGVWFVADEATALILDAARNVPFDWMMPPGQWAACAGLGMLEAAGSLCMHAGADIRERLDGSRRTLLSDHEVLALSRVDELAFHPISQLRVTSATAFAACRRIGLPRGTVAAILARELGVSFGDLAKRKELQVRLAQSYTIGHGLRARAIAQQGKQAVVMAKRG